ncbi:hypothetical protein [Tenggerimyces flavus]|uniref:DUF4386 family protein n=1 Tax=Tenggerimyces flavus TaxID=1708749 RepID=A0ABV7YAF3_9ACTN|nr:hypothetical protein [Tenggerimyces flavus]MBM7785477.1 hypothetical protein [Tenggerimyces flavus]
MATSVAAPVRDQLAFWRVLLAVLAPIPMLAQGIYYILLPVNGSAGFEETVAAYTANLPLLTAIVPLNAIFATLLIPATVAVAWATHRAAPTLTRIGALISLVGFFVGFATLGGVDSFLVAQKGLDVASIAPLYNATEESLAYQLGGLLFIVGIVVGLTLLGIALWRSRVAPAWVGIALALGTVTHPFLPGHVAQGAGLLVAAVGFAGASLALLKASPA